MDTLCSQLASLLPSAQAIGETMTTLPSLENLQVSCAEVKSHGVARDLFSTLFTCLIDRSASSDDQAVATERILAMKPVLQENETIRNMVVDIIWMETSLMGSGDASKSDVDYPEALINVVKTLSKDVPDLQKSLLETIDSKLLQQSGIIAEENDLLKKIRMTNTSTNYRQHKFNLLSEESEGWAKFLYALRLVSEIDGDADGDGDEEMKDSDLSTPKPVDLILKLIGTFSLDPNRCLDIVLELWGKQTINDSDVSTQSDTQSKRFLEIIQRLATDKLPALLAFQFSEKAKDEEKTQVLRSAASLVSKNLLDLKHFLAFLPEWVPLLQSTYDALKKQTRENIRALGRVSLSGNSKKGDAKSTVDCSPLLNHPTTKIISIFLKRNEFKTIETIFQPYWSKLCFVLPESIGCFICDLVEKDLVFSYTTICKDMQLPWTLNNGANNGSSELEIPTQDSILETFQTKLEYTKESGCIGLRATLFAKILRILTLVLDKHEPTTETISFVKSFLLPATSLFHSNPSISLQMWRLCQKFDYKIRYSMYAAWRGAGLERKAFLSDKALWLVHGEMVAGKDTRNAMKRLSKETVRDSCRAISKVSHSHPLIVFSTILNQIESYDNLVEYIMLLLRSMTPLALDVLGFCILSRLDGSDGGLNRSRLKDDGVNVSQWLQSLELFIGSVYKNFPSLELTGIVSYLMERVGSGHVMELGVLRALLKESGGWAFADYAPAASLTATQLDGRAGSVLLMRETMSFGVTELLSERAASSVRSVLQSDNIGVKILILLSQMPYRLIFDSGSSAEKPIKLIGNLVDTCQVTCSILLEFLTESFKSPPGKESEIAESIHKFAESLPSLQSLCADFKLDAAHAWQLVRPLVRATKSFDLGGEGGTDNSNPLGSFLSGEAHQKLYKDMVPHENFWTHISPILFEIFYSSSLYDIFYPDHVYNAEIDRLGKEEERCNREAEQQAKPSFQDGPTRIGPEPEDPKRKAEVAKRTRGILQSEKSGHDSHSKTWRASIAKKSDEFFRTNPKEAAPLFFSHCIYPRMMQGPDDSLYCAKFILLLHKEKVPNFRILDLLDILIPAISKSLFGTTEGESSSASILLLELWKEISQWRYEKEYYESEFHAEMTDSEEDTGAVSFDQFILLYNKWHATIGATALGCMKSNEYIHVRNALVVLTRLVEQYPAHF